MRQIYSCFMYLLSPYLLFRLWWKGRNLPAYRERIAERFSLDQQAPKSYDIWIHAVSLGEVIAVTPLIEVLLNKNWRILITTMTPTGARQVNLKFADKLCHRYIPYDLADAIRRFFKKNKPRLGLIVETELWPNLIHYAASINQIPLFLINARLSERSYQGYKKGRFLFEPLLNQFKAIFTQSEDDAKRFIALGANEGRVSTLGNMKFDLNTKPTNPQIFVDLKQSWGALKTVFMAASTHDDEEQQLLSRLKKLQTAIPGMILLIAPRHPERFQKVYQLCRDLGFNTGLRSDPESLNEENEVVVLDSLGELLGFYQISDYAFVGGSLIPIGGHNVLEPIAMQVPVFSGPEVHNFKTICRDLQAAQAIEIATNADDLIDRIIALHRNESLKKRRVQNATAVLEANKGAVQRYAARAEAILEFENQWCG